MEEDNVHKDNEPQSEGVPIPVVKLNRWILVIGIVSGLILQQPLVTTALFGRRWSLIAQVGKLMFAKQIPQDEREDFRLARFNNTIATLLLGGAQVAFFLKAPIVGWVLSLMVAVAAGVALAGFCVGCFLYFQFKMQRYRFLGR